MTQGEQQFGWKKYENNVIYYIFLLWIVFEKKVISQNHFNRTTIIIIVSK